MKGRRGALLVALGLAALAGCRGIVGITDLAVVDGGIEEEAGADASDAKPGPDTAPPDAGPSADDGGCAARSSTQSPCQPCCHQVHASGFAALQRAALATGCICAGGGDTDCTSQCGTSVCADASATGTSVPGSCNQCLDARLGSPACVGVTTECAEDCKGALDCLRSCPQ